jgi:hypothetical protein
MGQFDGIENEDMRRYLEEQAGIQRSAVFEIAYRKAIDIGKSAAEAKAAAEEAERKNVYGFDYKKDRNGEPIQQGIGSRQNPSINHIAAMRKSESMGLLPPGSTEREIAEIRKATPEWAAKHLPPPVRA